MSSSSRKNGDGSPQMEEAEFEFAWDAFNKQANFAIGGTLVIDEKASLKDFQTVSAPVIAPPVVVRWDGPAGSRVSFPSAGRHGKHRYC